MPRAVVLIANGSEEMEAVISIDVLRRAGIQVTVCGVDDGTIECSRQVKIVPDTRISQLENDYDLLVLPGGLGGAKTFSSDVRVQDLLQSFFESQKWIGIICASPISLLSRGLGKGRKITSHPSVKSQMVGYDYQEERVVVDGNLITSRGPGTSFEFALKLVELVCGPEKRTEIEKPMIL